jgi:hypothetical protein
MINTIPGGIFEHARVLGLLGNPGFSHSPFEAPSPTGGGGVSSLWEREINGRIRASIRIGPGSMGDKKK